jgi:DNA-binding MarR family transcriptional regulator
MARIYTMTYSDKHIYAMFTAQHLLKNRLVKTFVDGGIKITPSHSTILFLLEKNDSQTMTDLSNVLHLDNSTVTGLVDRLEKMGFVLRTDHPLDRRKWRVSISKEGLGEIAKARVLINRINKEMESGFTSYEMDVFHKILSSFNAKFS